MENKKIRIGVLGGAQIAVRSIIPGLLNLPKYFELVGVASRTSKNAEEIASKFKIQAFEGYNSLLDKNIIDAIYVPLPNSLHYEWVSKALEANLHVIVEKSMACTLEEVIALNELAKKNKLILLENFQFRFHHQLARIKQLMDEGSIGDIRCLRSSFGFPPFPDADNIRYQGKLGGGALLDAGAYPTKIAKLLLGRELTVSAANLWYDKERNIDIWGGAYIKQLHGDLFAEIAFGFDNYYQCNVEIWGSKGKIYTNRIFTAPANYQPIIYIETKEGLKEETMAPDDHFKGMLNYFYNLVIGNNNADEEYVQNISQAKLLSEIKLKSVEK